MVVPAPSPALHNPFLKFEQVDKEGGEGFGSFFSGMSIKHRLVYQEIGHANKYKECNILPILSSERRKPYDVEMGIRFLM